MVTQGANHYKYLIVFSSSCLLRQTRRRGDGLLPLERSRCCSPASIATNKTALCAVERIMRTASDSAENSRLLSCYSRFYVQKQALVQQKKYIILVERGERSSPGLGLEAEAIHIVKSFEAHGTRTELLLFSTQRLLPATYVPANICTWCFSAFIIDGLGLGL